MKKRWKIAEELNEEKKQLKKTIIDKLKCPELIAELLIRKGFTEEDDIDNFFNPSIEHMHDPFLFKDMEKAVNRVILAINRKDKIIIYGDYDVDGATSTALLYLGLRKLGATVEYFIPHRMIDGYGLSLGGVSQLKEGGTDLIISVDCGVNGIDEIDEINKLGMDIIITDHHNPKDELPKAFAIINPKLIDTKYPYINLAGVGVAFKLLQGVYKTLNCYTKENIESLIDLVAVGTIADIVPLTGENRLFASIGLKKLAKKTNIGLVELSNIAGLANKELNTTDIVFGLAPRINAAGRMGSAMRAVELLVSDQKQKSIELAEIIESENSIRQQIDQKTFEEACEIIEKKYKNLDETYCIVISSDNWHPGVIGIVASKLVEKYYRPTIMITFKDGMGSGSGRSIADFDLFEALTNLEDLLDGFGGHKYAAGLSIMMEYIDRFENQLNAYTKEHINKSQLIPPLNLDYEIELYEINHNLLKWLGCFAPFGPGNMRPVFFSNKVMIVGYPYTVGRNHLKLKVKKDGCELDLIGFNMGDFLPFLKKGSYINIAYSLELITWQRKKIIQGKLKDIHFVR